MTKSQFLQSLETELKSRRLPDAGEILEEYEQHFSFKLADGYTEQEIARKLGSPFEIAVQFDHNRRNGKLWAAGPPLSRGCAWQVCPQPGSSFCLQAGR